MKKQRIALLGSTGSIGTQTLDIIASHSDKFTVTALAAGRKNIELLSEQVRRFCPKFVSVPGDEEVKKIKELIPNYKGEIGTGKIGLDDAATHPDCDTVVGAMVGFSGLVPTMAAIKAGKRICLANKETLVSAGELVTALAKEYNVPIIPIDSEHSAVLQSLAGSPKSLERVLLTASGGPFREWSFDDMTKATPQMALKHPNWSMGAKITIDSATMMNKGLEIIEAHWLFGVSYEKIDVVIHPQSIVHSLVEFCDGSIIAQLGLPDMRLPILYALTYPKRVKSDLPRLNLSMIKQLTFFEPDTKRFPALRLAREAGEKGGTYPAVFNAANEVAVDRFLSGEIGFLEIPSLVEYVLNSHKSVSHPVVEVILEVDEWTREISRKYESRFSITVA